MINVVLCDDKEEYSLMISEQIKSVIADSRYAKEDVRITVFRDSVETMKYCLQNEVHILLLDIDMPVMTGFDVANVIRENNDEIKIIFVSALENLVYTSFRYQPFRFIRKEMLSKELSEAILSAMKELLYKEMYLTVTGKTESRKIFYSEICLIESRANYVEIVTVNGEKIKYRTTMSDLAKQLGEYGFIRIHAGYLVSMKKIKFFKNDTVEMAGGKILKVSRKYYGEARDAFHRYLRNEM